MQVESGFGVAVVHAQMARFTRLVIIIIGVQVWPAKAEKVVNVIDTKAIGNSEKSFVGKMSLKPGIRMPSKC